MGHDVSTGIIEFILDHFTEDNEGTYTCQITDGGGKGQSSLVLIGDGKLDKIGIMRENLSWIPKSNLFSYAYMRASECLIPWNDVYLNHVKEALGNITLFFSWIVIPLSFRGPSARLIQRQNLSQQRETLWSFNYSLFMCICMCTQLSKRRWLRLTTRGENTSESRRVRNREAV